MNKSLAFVLCFALFHGFASASPAPDLLGEVSNIVNGVITIAQNSVKSLSSVISKIISDILSVANNAIQNIASAVNNLATNARNAGFYSIPFQMLWTNLGVIARQVAGEINTLQSSAQTIAQNILPQVQTLSKTLETAINGLVSNTTSILNEAVEEINKDISNAITSGNATIQNCAEAAQTAIENVVQNSTAAISTCTGSALDQANTTLQEAQDISSSALDSVSNLALNLSSCVQLNLELITKCLQDLLVPIQANTALNILTSANTDLNKAVTTIITNLQACGTSITKSVEQSIAAVGDNLQTCIAA